MIGNRLMLASLFAAATLAAASRVHDFTLTSIDGQPAPLAAYKGKVLLLVNVASKCGYTPQYAGLQRLYEQYADRGLVVLGVPANNFGSQEPGSNEEIKTFCTRTYNVSFPMMSKVSVKGEDQTPLYRYLTSTAANSSTAGDVRWNFTKFLVDKTGKVVARFESKVAPEAEELRDAVERELRK